MRDFLLTSIFLVVLWTCIHLLARRYRQKSILPLTYHAGSQRQHVGHYEFQLKGVHTKLVTTVYNAFHERMCETFASQQRLAASLRVFYDIGTLFAYIGLIGGTLVVAYQGASLLAFATSSGPSTSLGKRDGLEIEQAASGMPLTLIVCVHHFFTSITTTHSTRYLASQCPCHTYLSFCLLYLFLKPIMN